MTDIKFARMETKDEAINRYSDEHLTRFCKGCALNLPIRHFTKTGGNPYTGVDYYKPECVD